MRPAVDAGLAAALQSRGHYPYVGLPQKGPCEHRTVEAMYTPATLMSLTSVLSQQSAVEWDALRQAQDERGVAIPLVVSLSNQGLASTTLTVNLLNELTT